MSSFRPFGRCLPSAVVLLALFAASLPLTAAPPDSTLGWLAAHSTDIVRGRVTSLRSFWNEDHTQIYTEVELAVQEVLKGEAVIRVRLLQPGGQVGDIAQRSAHEVTFSAGEEVLVFAQPADGSLLRLASVAEGKLPLHRDEEGRLWVPRAARQAVAPEVHLPTDEAGRVAWSEFSRLVRRLVEEPENGLRRTDAPALGSVAAAATPVAGQPIENAGFHVVEITPPPNSIAANRCPNEPTPFVHWDLREFPECRVPYEINPTHDNPGIANASFINEIHAAAGQWTGVAPSHIVLFDNTQDSQCLPNRRDNRNCVSWLRNFAWGPNLVAWTTWWVDIPSGKILESDVFLNPTVAWNVTPSPLPNPCPVVLGIQSTFLHEFGHFVGLGHPQLAQNGAVCGNDDPNQVTKMYRNSTALCQIQLHQADKDGINYLYTQDLGDLPDPPYPTLVHQNVNANRRLSGVDLKVPNDGPSHLFGIYRDPDPDQVNFPRYQYEWLAFEGGAIDDHADECEARPVDQFDDGVSIQLQCVNGQIQGMVSVILSVQTSPDVRGRVHTYNPNDPMYLNGWFDWNLDGDFADFLEHVIGPAPGSVRVTAPGAYAFQFLPPPGARCDAPSRFRLDWREDVGQIRSIDPTLALERGAAQHGEVEDYLSVLLPDPPMPKIPHPEYCHPKSVPVHFPGGRVVNMLDLCHPPKPKRPGTALSEFFPPAGGECMHSTLTLGIDVDLDDEADEVVGLTGDVCVMRSDPFFDADGLKVIDTEMISLDMVGSSELAGDLHVGLAEPSFGQIRQSPEAAEMGVDVSVETPASSFFDVVFVVDTELFGTSNPTGPSRVTAEIAEVPPGEGFEELPPPEEPTADETDPTSAPADETLSAP